VSAPEVVLYVTGWCPYCERARSLLTDKGVAYREIDVEAVPGAYAEMVATSRRRTVPQIFIGGSHTGGCDDLLELEADGRLDALLNTTGAT
jgi:glutaredoxin 3